MEEKLNGKNSFSLPSQKLVQILPEFGSESAFVYNAGSVSGSAYNQCGSETLIKMLSFLF
jgi:hypothetical protein